ncbi:Hypothetical predicted protein [Olea europaea subsp. europaea]|uniref:Uncharacterized protein n=1 Tax=Olea europaea subsp. europaea TaxID=158383 RepID=A0A8S0SVU0_OLEEU|nr:Hypothetical predicted protein [Olea europaea subsp. europaea]
MEGGKKSLSGSSIACGLFGSMKSASFCGIFRSLFAAPDKVQGQESLNSIESGKKAGTSIQAWSSTTRAPDKNATNPSNKNQSQSKQSEDINMYFPGEKIKPFHYSSSIYYGGQDVYNFPECSNRSGFTTSKKDEAEDDSEMASRGDWWRGSLYY